MTTNNSIEYWTMPQTNQMLLITLLPIGFFGFILNVSSFIILKNRDFELNVYGYIRVYTLNSSLICLLTSTRFIYKSHHFFKFSNTFTAQNYGSKFFVPIMNILYFFGSSLDILLTIDRMIIFSNRFQCFNRLKPMKVCFCLFIISIILNSYFWKTRMTETIEINVNETIFKVYLSTSSDDRSLFGVLMSNVSIDLLPILFEIPLSVLTIIYLKFFIKKKRNMTMKKRITSISLDSISNRKRNDDDLRVRSMEIKVTILIIIISLLALL
jgi:hypothetical protein